MPDYVEKVEMQRRRLNIYKKTKDRLLFQVILFTSFQGVTCGSYNMYFPQYNIRHRLKIILYVVFKTNLFETI